MLTIHDFGEHGLRRGTTSRLLALKLPESRVAAATLLPDPAWQPAVPADVSGVELTLLNAWRAANGPVPVEKAALAIDPRLLLASAYAVRGMSTYDFASHDWDALPDGKPAIDWADRIFDSGGYPDGSAIAENIAWGVYGDPSSVQYDQAGNVVSVNYELLFAGVIAAFASDPGHRANQLAVGPGCGLSLAFSKPATSSGGSVVPSLPFFEQCYGTAALPSPTPPNPPPPPAPTGPQPGERWRLAAKPKSALLLILEQTTPAEVVFENTKTGKTGRQKEPAFSNTHVRVS